MSALRNKYTAARAAAVKKQTTDLDNVKTFSAEEKDFKGLNKTVKVPYPKPKVIPDTGLTTAGDTADNGRLKAESTMSKNVARSQHGVPVTAPKPINVKNKKGRVATKLDNSLEGLERRRKMSGGHALLMPQAEAYIAPTTGNNNYAQNLPAGTDTSKKRVKYSVYKRDIGAPADAIKEANEKDPKGDYTTPHLFTTRYIDKHIRDSRAAHDAVRALAIKLRKEKEAKENNESVISSFEDLYPIFETHGYVLVAEEVQVGQKGKVDGDNEVKKFKSPTTTGGNTGRVSTVKRKYLGNQKGRTATGKPAHAIDIQPMLGIQTKDWNKTTPSGDKPK
jgi:LysM repeat protein